MLRCLKVHVLYIQYINLFTYHLENHHCRDALNAGAQGVCTEHVRSIHMMNIHEGQSASHNASYTTGFSTAFWREMHGLWHLRNNNFIFANRFCMVFKSVLNITEF